MFSNQNDIIHAVFQIFVVKMTFQTAPDLVNDTLKMNKPLFWVIFRLTHFKVTIFSLTQTMRLNGCLKEKINVIRPLEKFLSDFEKKVSTLFEPKVLVYPEKFVRKISFQNFSQKIF